MPRPRKDSGWRRECWRGIWRGWFGLFLALVDALEASDPDTLLGVLDARFDLDALLTTLAVDLLAGNWDGYARAANNFLLYHAPEADEWHLLPWGQDQAFTDVNVPIDAGWEGRLLVLCGRAPACRARLYDRVGDVLTAWVQSDLHGYAADTVATLAPDCEADPRAEIPCLPEDVPPDNLPRWSRCKLIPSFNLVPSRGLGARGRRFR